MDLEVQHHCPNARVVYDLFHVVAKFGREVIDRVRAIVKSGVQRLDQATS
jgi:transposase